MEKKRPQTLPDLEERLNLEELEKPVEEFLRI